jgi:hypothetical protein
MEVSTPPGRGICGLEKGWKIVQKMSYKAALPKLS